MELEEIGCICNEYDGRGRSSCGVECLIHPLNGNCPSCMVPAGILTRTHNNRECFQCFAKSEEARKSRVLKELEAATHWLCKCFWALDTAVNPTRNEGKLSPNIPVAEVKAMSTQLRETRLTIGRWARMQDAHEITK